jgi:hypothetical protein
MTGSPILADCTPQPTAEYHKSLFADEIAWLEWLAQEMR